MIAHDIKHWLAELDFTHIDKRIRIPLLLLPLVFLVLLFSQFMAMRSASHVDALLSESVKAFTAQTNAQQSLQSPAGATGVAAIKLGLNQLHELAGQLQNGLAQGKNTVAQTAMASELLVITQPNNSATLPSMQFWQTFSQTLAKLENGVRTNAIVTPESKFIVEQLRTQYAQLRAISIAPESLSAAGDPAAGEQLNTGAANTGTNNSASNVTNAVNAAQLQLNKNRFWQTFSLLLSLLATALFTLLALGIWKSYQSSKTTVTSKNRREQDAILQLLDEITPLADGDLTIKATVSEAATGAVADAFNFAVTELRRLVKAVTESAELVKTSVSETRESAQQLAQASSVQAREIHRSSNYLNVMSDTMAQLSANAVDSSAIADTSLQQAQRGATAVEATVDGLQKIRAQAEITTGLMDRLHGSSQSISAKVADIQAIAKRSDLLALNTTIKAAAVVNGSDNSGDLSQLCDEVSHLAEILGRATQDIARETHTIEQDAQLVKDSMAQTNAELDDGLNTADQANSCLHSIENVSNDLHALVSDIASKSLRQAGVVKQLSANMGVINNITRDSSVGLQHSAKALDELQRITTELRKSVAGFQLPSDQMNREPLRSRRNKAVTVSNPTRRVVRDQT